MSSFVAALLIASQDHQILWRTIARSGELKTVPSWQDQSKAIDQRIGYLRSDSEASRNKKLDAIVKASLSSRDSAANAILYIRLIKTFPGELASGQSSQKLQIAIVNASGVTDFDFMREIYSFSYLNGHHVDCGGVGAKLAKKFPLDRELETAFLRDCAQGYAPLEDRYLALKKIPLAKDRLSKWDYHDLYAGITYTVTNLSKRSDYVSLSKEHLKKAISIAPTPDKKKFKQLMLDDLNKRFPNIK